jgi:hypothetical protein
MVWIIDNLVEVVTLFIEVAGNDPLAPLLLLGAIGVLTVALGSFGVLALGGIAAALTGS